MHLKREYVFDPEVQIDSKPVSICHSQKWVSEQILILGCWQPVSLSPTEQPVFQNADQPTLTLATCEPSSTRSAAHIEM